MFKHRAPAGQARPYKRADGLWVGTVEIPTADGRRRQKRVYSKDRNTVVAKLRELRAEVAKGNVPHVATMSVGKWLDYWLKVVHGPHVRPKTRKFYEEAIRLHISPACGAKRLGRLTPKDIRDMLDTIDTSRNRQRAHQTLNLALKAAVVDGVLSRNPCEAVRKPGHLQEKREGFDVDVAKHIIRVGIELEASRDETEPRLATRWAAAFLTGARKAEVLGLEWDRVDLENGVLDFAWQLQSLDRVHGCLDDAGAPTCGRQRPSYCPQARWDLEDGFEYRECYRSLLWTKPKTEAGTRVVPTVPGLLELLRQHRVNTAGDPNPHNLVWHFPDGRPIAPGEDHERWHALLKAAGLPPATLHAARHTAASMLQDADVDEPTRMAIMGQSSVAAHRAYLHFNITQKRAALEAGLNQLLQ